MKIAGFIVAIFSFIVALLLVVLVLALVMAMISGNQIGLNSFNFFQNKEGRNLRKAKCKGSTPPSKGPSR